MENYKINGYKIRIEQDEDTFTPDEAENTDVFLIAHHRSFTVRREGFPSDAPRPALPAGYNYLPLYAYIHSGVALSLGDGEYPFNCQWDSCQVGWVIIADTVGAHLAGKESMRRRVAQALVDEWNQYLSGDVWWVQICDRRGDEVESCGGFYGLDNAKEWARLVAQEKDKSEEWTEREAIEYLRACLKNLRDRNLIKGDNDHINEVDWCLEKTEYWAEKEAK